MRAHSRWRRQRSRAGFPPAVSRLTIAFGLTLSSLFAGALPDVTLNDVNGKPVKPLACGEKKASVIIFTTTDCPIANSYAPEITRLAEKYAEKGVKFTLVHVDPDLRAEKARSHAGNYKLDRAATILVDRKHALVKALGATMTPEAAIVTPEGKLAYLGRIDDLYTGYGDRRNEATKRDLRDAIDAVLGGRPVPSPRTETIGCDIPELE